MLEGPCFSAWLVCLIWSVRSVQMEITEDWCCWWARLACVLLYSVCAVSSAFTKGLEDDMMGLGFPGVQELTRIYLPQV